MTSNLCQLIYPEPSFKVILRGCVFWGYTLVLLIEKERFIQNSFWDSSTTTSRRRHPLACVRRDCKSLPRSFQESVVDEKRGNKKRRKPILYRLPSSFFPFWVSSGFSPLLLSPLCVWKNRQGKLQGGFYYMNGRPRPYIENSGPEHR